jgi:hypothetical protein
MKYFWMDCKYATDPSVICKKKIKKNKKPAERTFTISISKTEL